MVVSACGLACASTSPAPTSSALLCVLLLLGSATVRPEAWGPATQYKFASGAPRAGDDADGCAQNTAASGSAWLLSSAEMPDAFYSGGFLTGRACTRSRSLHGLVFAGHQLQAAVREQPFGGAAPEQENGGFSALDYALGFCAHVVGDYAGCLKGGYLGNGHLPAFGNITREWVSIWPFMSAIDAYMLHNASSTSGGAGRFASSAAPAPPAVLPALTPNARGLHRASGRGLLQRGPDGAGDERAGGEPVRRRWGPCSADRDPEGGQHAHGSLRVAVGVQ